MIGGNANLFVIPDLPAPIGVWVAIHIVTPEHETGPEQPHQFRSHVLDPSMEPVAGSEMQLDGVISPPPPIPGGETEEVVATFHHFSADSEGTYTIEMRVDDRTKAIPITVNLPQAEPDEAGEVA